jgi:integrase
VTKVQRKSVNRTPSYRQRKGYDQALVTLTDSATGKRRDYWLGVFNSPESRERYHRVIAEWEANARRLPAPDFDRSATGADSRHAGGPTVDEVALRFWRWAQSNHRPREARAFRPVLRLLRQMDGSTPARDFGPNRLRLVREAMVNGDASADPPRSPWSRSHINQQVQKIRRVFKWAASHEMIPPTVHQALATVEPLKKGRSAARESARVTPAPIELVEAARPHMNRQVRAIVDLQLLTGARPGELVGMRAIDLDMDTGDSVWAFRPASHKNAHRGVDRTIYLGPKAREVVRPFLTGRAIDAPLFSPAEANAEYRAAIHARRTTPLSCGNAPGKNRRESSQRQPGSQYTVDSCRRAIERACDKAFPPPPPLAKKDDETIAQWQARLTPEQQAELKAWRKAHRFHPYQLRHTAATQIRREFGLEAAQLALGHASATITDAVYAERDAGKVIEVMRRVG